MKKLMSMLLAVICALGLVACTVNRQQAQETATPLYNQADEATEDVLTPSVLVSQIPENTKSIRIQDDYYEYINVDWLNQVEATEEEPRVMRATKLQEQIDKQLQEDFEAIVKNGVTQDTEYLSKAVDYYLLYTDIEKRNREGITPLQPYLDQIDAAETLEDFNKIYADLLYWKANYPFATVVIEDPVYPKRNILIMGAPSNYLSNAQGYEDGNQAGKKDLELIGHQIKTVAMTAGMSEIDAQKMADDSLAFDRIISGYMQTPLQNKQSAYSADSYIPFKELASYSKNVDFTYLINSLLGSEPKEIKVMNFEYYKNIDSVVNEENLPMMKNWIKAGCLLANAPVLSEELFHARYATLDDNGTNDSSADAEGGKEDFAEYTKDYCFAYLKERFAPELSKYYSDKYLSADTKQDITEMFDGMIAEYKDRMKQNDWLEDATRDKAIEKLDKMKLFIGNQSKISPESEKLQIKSVEESGTLLECELDIQKNSYQAMFEKLNKTNEDTERFDFNSIKSFEVNAAYVPQINSIVINSAILNDPYYNRSYSDSYNYGAIGAVIGHEISHAFDMDGSRFDADGNMVNWWTESDEQKFEIRTQKMIDFFDGLPFFGGEVDGELTVSENTADAGGLSVALEVLEHSTDIQVNYEEFFEAWAKLWASKSIEKDAQQRLIEDVHAPGIYRVNRQMMLIDQFYNVYKVQEGDEMYLLPEDRFYIW